MTATPQQPRSARADAGVKPRNVGEASTSGVGASGPSAAAAAPAEADGQRKKGLVIVDAPNVAIRHGRQAAFSSRGVQLALDYWEERGFRAIGFLPEYYLSYDKVGTAKRAAELGLKDHKQIPDDVPLLRKLEAAGRLVLTPPQDYDDSYCISYAMKHNGCVMTNDLYRDHVQAVVKRGGARQPIEAWLRKHCISFTFLGDELLTNPDFVFPTH